MSALRTRVAWVWPHLLLGLGLLACARTPAALTAAQPTSSSPEPLMPTLAARATAAPSRTAPVAVRPIDRTLVDRVPVDRARLGVGVPGEGGLITDYAVEQLGIGWYLNWGVEITPARPGGLAFWQMVRVFESPSGEAGYRPDIETIRAAAVANPGSTWLIGNEPDVAWQDHTTPERYAGLYHELYRALKDADPTCRVAIGAVSQPTPLRLAYLEQVLDAYQARFGEPMPVDVWNVHGFVIREERGSWGVGIPPGSDAEAGVLYEVEDHGSQALFQEQILAFRRWMAEHGQRERPLVLSEFGILMPADYGFDPARVQAYMVAAFDYLNTATDERVGCPQDGDRLVQWWAWYSLADTVYPTGNLFDPETKALTDLGSALAAYRHPAANDSRP